MTKDEIRDRLLLVGVTASIVFWVINFAQAFYLLGQTENLLADPYLIAKLAGVILVPIGGTLGLIDSVNWFIGLF